MAIIIGTKWVIRQKSTGFCLPVPKGRMGRGGSFVEPCRFDPQKLSTQPRLFDTQRGAQNCLSQWLRGHHHMEYDIERDHPGDIGYRVEIGTSVTEVPHRKREDMEVIQVDIIPT